MGRETGSIFKISKRLNFSILENDKEFKRRDEFSGVRKQRKGRKNNSSYKKQLVEKQKLRHLYQVSETQLKNIYIKAEKKPGITSLTMLLALESRLDNIVYRLKFTSTRRQSRQLVNHGHVLVDGKKVDIASYSVKVGQVITVSDKAKEFALVKEALATEMLVPEYLELDSEKFTGSLKRQPVREELNASINEALIVEFYNRLL